MIFEPRATREIWLVRYKVSQLGLSSFSTVSPSALSAAAGSAVSLIVFSITNHHEHLALLHLTFNFDNFIRALSFVSTHSLAMSSRSPLESKVGELRVVSHPQHIEVETGER